MRGTLVSFAANGGTATGYLSLPPSGHGPGLLVLQEWWGLVDHIKDVADRFAEAGYVVLAPDLYRGESAGSPDEAQRLMMALDMPFTAQALRGGAEYLRAHPAVAPRRVGALGFCLGGQLALFAATAHPDVIDAVVDFYGVFNPRVPVDLTALRAPVLAHFGRTDKSIPVERAEGLLADITARGVPVEGYFYDAGHAFFNDARAVVYDAAAAQTAWTRTLDFLQRTLG
ncbi:MAG: dienelactone hydrolase family protein [Gemmatimonadaceae bacterium]|nr:dienelactone hydrolase family protein [Gemmatimonadaceae bacterium]